MDQTSQAAARWHAAFGRLLAQPAGPCTPDRGFLEWLAAHRMAPYAWHRARAVDGELAQALRAHALRVAGQRVLQDRDIAAVLARLNQAGVRPVVFKGLGMAHLHYPEPLLRPLGDVDLLFRREDMSLVLDALSGIGFRIGASDPAVLAYYMEDGYNVPLHRPDFGRIEAHHALYRDCEPPFLSGVLAAVRPGRLLESDVAVLPPADLFIILAVHFVESGPGACWLWLLDLVLLGRRLGNDDWRDLATRTSRHGLQIFVLAAVGLAERLWSIRFDLADPLSRLESELAVRERRALADLASWPGHARYPGDRLTTARRLSWRPVRAQRGLLDSIVCHPGVVCIELAVASTSLWFPVHRVRHAGHRLRRALTAAVGLGTTPD